MKLLIKRLGKLFAIILGLIILFFCGLMADVLLTSYAASAIAYSLAPPEYPNSELIERWQSGGSDSMWDRSTYRTEDNVDEVITFMEAYLPEFSSEENQEGAIVYRSSVRSTNWIARHAAKIACTTLYCIEKSAYTYPSASVTVFAEPDYPTTTTIWIWLSWPAQ